ncbi:DUF805 domain-containing protein [uncultured Amphritea sp.]|uniref:DUF805 domain-containing protein n=1 Tax=uncultured Amphritea sp. TaxID=981605 RepID=UPI002636A57B|nr:DUF805 domain-containing protein [uncultured Amphritea sp.]
MNTNVYEAPKAELLQANSAVAPLTLKQILFSFQGRIGRKFFWLTALGMLVAEMVVFGLLTALTVSDEVLMIFVGLVYIPLVWVGLAIQVKRWHDRNKSGWWVLLNLVPLIGAIWVFIEVGCLAGDQNANDYGSPSA